MYYISNERAKNKYNFTQLDLCETEENIRLQKFDTIEMTDKI